MTQFWAFVAWLLSFFAPVEAAKCAACVTMAYAAQAKADTPQPDPRPRPRPRPDGCAGGCDCGGTGWVTSPEGFKLPCPCPDSCKCKQGK